MGPVEILLGFAVGSVGVAMLANVLLPRGGPAVRDLFVANARGAVGLGAAPDVRDTWLDLVAPDESEQMRTAMLGMNGCALLVRGLWRQAGVRHAALTSPYRIGMAVADVVQIAKDAGAWRQGSDGQPDVGDVFLIDNPEHVGTVVERPDDTTIRSVDGGQRDAQGFEAVRDRERVAVGGAWFGNDGVNNAQRRSLVGYCDCTALAETWGIG